MDCTLSSRLAFVIEDEVYLASIFAKALEYAGFQTLEINDGQTAMDCLSQASPALVVLDLNLPRVSGRDILRFIREEARFACTRVIIATSDSAAVAGEMDAKSDLVLLKPISFSQLRDLASRFL
jgi:DNA-binding response OmpR family regulator